MHALFWLMNSVANQRNLIHSYRRLYIFNSPGNNQKFTIVMTQERYDHIAMLFHWVIAVLILAMFPLGWYMTDLPKKTAERAHYFELHKSIGLTIALLVLLRIIWRLMKSPPRLPDSFPDWQKKAAKASHVLLYCMIVIQPLTGYVSSSFSGYSIKIWGFALPQWGWRNMYLDHLFENIHVACSVVLLCLIVIHVCGALAHWAGLHENVLPRMVPFMKRPEPPRGQ